MQWFPEDRKHLASGDHGALFKWMSEYLWLLLLLCTVITAGNLKYGLIAFAVVIISTVVIAIREYIGEHLYQIKTWGWSDWTLDQEEAKRFKAQRKQKRNNN